MGSIQKHHKDLKSELNIINRYMKKEKIAIEL